VGGEKQKKKEKNCITKAKSNYNGKKNKIIIITNIKKKTRRKGGKETLPTKIISVYEIFRVYALIHVIQYIGR